MNRWIGSAFLIAFLTVSSTRAAAPQMRNNQTRLEREVAALTFAHDLLLTDEQLKAIEPIAKQTAEEVPPSSAPAGSNAYRGTLRNLRNALVSDDDEKVNKLQGKLDSLRDSEKIDPDTDLPIRDAAKSKAQTVLAMLSSNQVASYISLHADDVPGATDVLLDGITQCRGQSDSDFAALRKEAAEQVALLLAGMDHSKAAPVEQKVTDLLDKAHKLSDADFKRQSDELNAEARKITAGADPIDGLHHWMLREIASFLSNPQTANAINAKLNHTESKSE